MKDAPLSNYPAYMCSSSKAMEACVSPTSNPTKIQFFKNPCVQPYRGLQAQDHLTKSAWPPAAKDPGIIQTGDAPSDAQGATEPERVARPGGNVVGSVSDSLGKRATCDVKAAHDETLFALQTSVAGCSSVSQGDCREQTSPDGKNVQNKFQPRVSETVRSDTQTYLSAETTVLNQPLKQHINNKCNAELSLPEEETNSVHRIFHKHNKPILPGTSVSPTPKPWKAEETITGAGLGQRRPSNLSDIERQRGPIKKRHINFQPDVLDLSSKKTKVERITSPDGLGVPSTSSQQVLMNLEGNLKAKVNRESELRHCPTSVASYQGSLSSSPTSHNPGRVSTLSASTTPRMVKPYACEHCSSTFKHRHHVVRHMRAHSGERPFRCDHCSATFARKCVLTNHRRTHTGEKPYICSECGDTFSRKHHLVIHQRTHSGEKPYHCRDCGAAFARSHHVNRHRKTHEKEAEVDAEIQWQESNANRLDHKLPTMVSLVQPGAPDCDTECKPSLHDEWMPAALNTTTEMIKSPNLQKTDKSLGIHTCRCNQDKHDV